MLSFLHQVLIYGTVFLSQLHQFWNTIQSELADKILYTMSIRGIKMRSPKLQKDDKKAKKLRSEQMLLKGLKDIKQMLHYQGLLYGPKVIRSELINRHYDNLLAGQFGIKKIWEPINRKYNWLALRWDVEAYVNGCNDFLASKVVCHKLYGDLQLLLISTHW